MSTTKKDIIYPEFNISQLDTHWKKLLIDTPNNIDDWKEFYLFIVKKLKISYRFLFSRENFKGNSFRLFSYKSNLYSYRFT